MPEVVTINIELKDTTLEQANTMMRKLLKACDYEELVNIKAAKISKTISEVSVGCDIFDKEEDGR